MMTIFRFKFLFISVALLLVLSSCGGMPGDELLGSFIHKVSESTSSAFEWIVNFLMPSRKYRCLARYYQDIVEFAIPHGIDPDLVAAIMFQENQKCDPNLTGEIVKNPHSIHYNTRAIGLMQIMPKTADEVCGLFRTELLFIPRVNIKCGVEIITEIKKNPLCRTYEQIAAAYFGGTGACKTVKTDVTLNMTTSEYSESVMKHYVKIKELKSEGKYFASIW